MLPSLGRMWTKDFLVIDSLSYKSYACPSLEEKRPPLPYGPCYGDGGGFVRLVDTVSFKQEGFLPGYNGTLNVLSSLILEDLYPLLATHSMRPNILWPIARLHPNEVYVGHTVQSQEAWFESQRIDELSMTRAMIELLKQRKAEFREQK
jgi:hypothetical protein